MMLRRWTVLAIAFVAFAACGGSQSNDGTTTTGGTDQADAAQPETAATDAGATEAATDGASLVAERCTVCHDATPIEEETASRPGREAWLNVVNDMVSRGANLNEQERDVVVDYLASR
jgi:mono/diheme cytochrome c family protein